MPNEKIRKRTREVLKLVDLADKSNAKPRELSGGQQQRVAIARAIAKRPTILIADEPTGNLDPSMTDEMITLLEKINSQEKTTLLVVTHNDVMVEYHPKRTIRIDSGHVVNDGTRDDNYYKQSFYEKKKKKEEEEEERLARLAQAEKEEPHIPHPDKEKTLTDSEQQDQIIAEITMQMDAVKEVAEGDRTQ